MNKDNKQQPTDISLLMKPHPLSVIRSISSVGGSTCLIHTRSWVRAPHGPIFPLGEFGCLIRTTKTPINP